MSIPPVTPPSPTFPFLSPILHSLYSVVLFPHIPAHTRNITTPYSDSVDSKRIGEFGLKIARTD